MQETTLQIRERTGVSIDECARLCRTEPTFKCESMSHEIYFRICKWSNLFNVLNASTPNPYTNYSDGFTMYVSSALNDYELYPYSVSTENDLKEVPNILSPNECAFKCTQESEFNCKSFNFCEYPLQSGVKQRCLLSNKHNHELTRNGSVAFSPVCDHYSSLYNLSTEQ